MALLLEALAVRVHRPDVHHAIAIGDEIDAVFPHHGVRRRAFVIRRERDGFVLAVEAPQILHRSTLVSFGRASLPVPTGKEERVAVFGVRSLRRLGQGNDLALALLIHQRQHLAWQRRIAPRSDNQSAIASPACRTYVPSPSPPLPHSPTPRPRLS